MHSKPQANRAKGYIYWFSKLTTYRNRFACRLILSHVETKIYSGAKIYSETKIYSGPRGPRCARQARQRLERLILITNRPARSMRSHLSQVVTHFSRAAPPRFAWRAPRRAAASRQQGLTTLGKLTCHFEEIRDAHRPSTLHTRRLAGLRAPLSSLCLVNK